MRVNRKRTLYLSCFGEQPPISVEQYCAKGNQIGVNGHLVSRSYVNKQEQHVYVIELVVEELYFVEAKREQEAV